MSIDRPRSTIADFAPPGFEPSTGLTAVLPHPEASEMSNALAGPHPNDEKSGGLNETTEAPVARSAQSRCSEKSRVWVPATIVRFETVVGWCPGADATTCG